MAVNSPDPNSLAAKLGNSFVGVRNDLEINRHVFLGETSYVVRDPVSFEGHNFTPADYEILTSLRDDRSLNDVFESLKVRHIVDADQENDFYLFVIELQKRGLLSLPVTDAESLHQQFEQKRRLRSKNLLAKLLFLKIPLGSPDRLLKTTYHWVRPLFSKAFFSLWVMGVFAAIWVVISRWDAFTSDLATLFAFQNVPAIILVMSALKLWHELGHGYACRHYGISVPNAGLLFMIGIPLAFVDATGSWSLSKRWQRQVINLAGIYFEMMIAVLAAFVWAFSEQPHIKSLAHFTILISSVTTIAFNFNPLMKYDGYYVVADLLGIPNLKGRASLATQALCKRIFFGIPAAGSGSRLVRWILIGYGAAAAIYKFTLVIGISILIATQLWLVGLLVGGYYLVSSMGSMLWKTIRYLAWSDELNHHRRLAWAYLVVLVIGIPAILATCPVPGRAHARGVVESSSVNVVHVEEGGFLNDVCVETGQYVKRGEAIGHIENIQNVADRSRKQAELNRLEMEYRSLQLTDRVQANQIRQQIRRLHYELELQRPPKRMELIESPVDGHIVLCSTRRRLGRYFSPGEELLRIGTEGWLIRAVANAGSLADIKPQVGQAVHCRFHADPTEVHEGIVTRVSRAGSRVVPHDALTQLGGGFILVDPKSKQATEPFFELTIELKGPAPDACMRNGAICDIRFRREYEPLGNVLYRSLLRFANHINVKK